MGTRIVIKGANFSNCAVSHHASNAVDVIIGTDQDLWNYMPYTISGGSFGFKVDKAGYVAGFILNAIKSGEVKVVVYNAYGKIYESESITVTQGIKKYNILPIIIKEGQYAGLKFYEESYLAQYNSENGNTKTYTFKENGILEDSTQRVYPFNMVIGIPYEKTLNLGTSPGLWSAANLGIGSGAAYGFKSIYNGLVTKFVINAVNVGDVQVVVYDDILGETASSEIIRVSPGMNTYEINPLDIKEGQYIGLKFISSGVANYLNDSGDVYTYTMISSSIAQDLNKRILPFNFEILRY